LKLAVIQAVPGPIPLTSALWAPDVTVTTRGSEELQFVCAVTFWDCVVLVRSTADVEDVWPIV